MFQAFIIVLREGFEAFLVVAIILAYLVKIRRKELLPAAYWGVGASLFASAGLGFLILKTANQPLWEGTFGFVGALLVATLVIHMWKTGSHMKKDMEKRIDRATLGKPSRWAIAGVFLFTVLMVSREGMETAFLLIQVHEPRIVIGIMGGILAAVAMAFLWARFGHLIRLQLFFQVTSIFLLLFVLQILIYSFHEFAEAGVLPNSQALHLATEPFSSGGIYGRWLTPLMISICALWLVGAWILHRIFPKQEMRRANP